MVTLVIPGGKQIANYSNSAVTLFDAATNNPFYLCDYIPGQGVENSRSYPCQISAAASGAVWNGGRFYGNILESAARRTVYNAGGDDFNSAIWFPRNGLSLTLRNAVFGIAGNRNSGYIDGARTVQAGFTLIEDCQFYSCRDDSVEADNGTNLTLRRVFGEDLYVWISATGSTPSKIIRAENCLVRIHKWRELEPGQTVSGREEFQCGPVFKTNGSSSSPQWQFTNVTLATPRRWPESGYNRTRAALARMSCTNCTWLSYEGQLDTTNGLRSAVIAAGWNLVEGAAAEAAWQAQKTAWFGGGGGGVTPPVVQSLTSPLTVNTFVGAPTLTPPVVKSAILSGTNTAVSSFVANHGAYDAGDAVLVFVMNDGGTDRVGTPAVTGPNGETVTTEQTIVSDGNGGTAGHTIAAFSYIAGAGRSANTGITTSISGGNSATEQFNVAVIVLDGGTFNPSDILGNIAVTFSTAEVANVPSAAFTAASEDGQIIFVACRAADGITGAPAGWTQEATNDPGALAGYIATRDALTTASESVGAATFTTSINRSYVALTLMVNPASS